MAFSCGQLYLVVTPYNAAGKTSAYMSATMATREKPIELQPGESLTARYKIVVTDEEHE